MARNYCLVENGIVVDGPRDLPKAWRNISGLNNSTNEELKVLGWLPFVENEPSYNDSTHWRDKPSVDIQNDQVVYNQVLVPYTEQELKQNAWNDWVGLMFNSDNLLPRYVEDMMDALIAKYPDAYDAFPELKLKYTEKKDARKTRP